MNDSSAYLKKSGVILAEITNIRDPDNLNRVKCKPVTTDKDVAETDWCYCAAPMAGKGYGQFFFPNPGDLVLLSYLGGDVHHPLVLGSYWANDVKPPYQIQEGKNEVRSIKTPAGIEIKLEDTEKKEKITITTPAGATLLLDDEQKSVTIKDQKAENQLLINWEKGEITLAAKTKLTLSAGDTSLVLESSGNLTATASKAMECSANDISLQSKASFKAEGAQMDLKSSGVLNAQASGNTVIKGLAVQIN